MSGVIMQYCENPICVWVKFFKSSRTLYHPFNFACFSYQKLKSAVLYGGGWCPLISNVIGRWSDILIGTYPTGQSLDPDCVRTVV